MEDLQHKLLFLTEMEIELPEAVEFKSESRKLVYSLFHP